MSQTCLTFFLQNGVTNAVYFICHPLRTSTLICAGGCLSRKCLLLKLTKMGQAGRLTPSNPACSPALPRSSLYIKIMILAMKQNIASQYYKARQIALTFENLLTCLLSDSVRLHSCYSRIAVAKSALLSPPLDPFSCRGID